jgi:hypothetical protein
MPAACTASSLSGFYGGAVIFVTAFIGVFVITLAVEAIPGVGNQSVVNTLAILGTAALPVCMGVAVLRYRLYELNRVISRVVSYTLITALLGGLFAGLILLATRVLPVKGSAAVAVATLIIAALFNPHDPRRSRRCRPSGVPARPRVAVAPRPPVAAAVPATALTRVPRHHRLCGIKFGVGTLDFASQSSCYFMT